MSYVFRSSLPGVYVGHKEQGHQTGWQRRGDSRRWRGRGAGWGMVFLSAVGILVLAGPNTAACAVLDVMPLVRLPDGSLADARMPETDRVNVVGQHRSALARIAATYGQPRAQPRIVHLSRPDALWPLIFNSYGSTFFLPGRSCVVLGPDGRNVDVFAHELVHAELFDRLGWWRRLRALPVWFDEGVAMQVDDRNAFDLHHRLMPDERATIRTLDTGRAFFGASPDRLVNRYAIAKREVGVWLATVGRRRLYERINMLRDGSSFDSILRVDALPSARCPQGAACGRGGG